MDRKKVLLVDDSNTVLLVERTMFDDGRFRIVTAKNGKEAIETAAREHPDIIFMDVVMPIMDGLEACRALRARPETRPIPIVMVTTRGAPQDVEAGFAAGCDAYIAKPFNHAELMDKLGRYLGLEHP